MQGRFRALVAAAALAASALASAQVTTDVYSGYAPSGDGTPFSARVGTLSTPAITFATDTGFNWHPFGLGAFGSRSTGTLTVAAAGDYQFGLTSDDGSSLYIDGVRIINNPDAHGPQLLTGTATLAPGAHPFVVNFFEDFGGSSGVDLTLAPGVVYAVPEPGALALLLAGIAVLGFRLRRA